jgi:hypothetical protein
MHTDSEGRWCGWCSVEIDLLGPLRPLEPLVAWLLRRQTTADLRRLKPLLEARSVGGSASEAAATRSWTWVSADHRLERKATQGRSRPRRSSALGPV